MNIIKTFVYSEIYNYKLKNFYIIYIIIFQISYHILYKYLRFKQVRNKLTTSIINSSHFYIEIYKKKLIKKNKKPKKEIE